MICFDSHLHIGEVYYGRRAKSIVKYSPLEAVEYFENEGITHCNALYTRKYTEYERAYVYISRKNRSLSF